MEHRDVAVHSQLLGDQVEGQEERRVTGLEALEEQCGACRGEEPVPGGEIVLA